MSEQAADDWSALRAQILADPERVRADAGLLQALGLKLQPANVVEFGAAALSRIEAARLREMTARQEIEAIAKANFAAQAQTHAMTVELLDARNNSDLAQRIDEAARNRFGVAAGAVAVEGPGPVPAGWQALHPGLADMLLGGGAWRMGKPPGLAQVFGETAAASLESAALVRIELWNGRTGVLGFGSTDPEGFTHDMGAELVAFLAKVVERTADRWAPV
jgi:uncharacterized protein YigA (DUF484 family)